MDNILRLSNRAALRVELLGGYTYELREYASGNEGDFTVFVKSGGTIEFTVVGNEQIRNTCNLLEKALNQ